MIDHFCTSRAVAARRRDSLSTGQGCRRARFPRRRPIDDQAHAVQYAGRSLGLILPERFDNGEEDVVGVDRAYRAARRSRAAHSDRKEALPLAGMVCRLPCFS